jgi:hypothetical protein
VNDLAGVKPADWDALDHGASPFLEHGFLRALEVTGSTGEDSGWAPVYLLAEVDDGEDDSAPSANARLVGAVPCFVKSHSYGEYIFDWGWARASSRAGVRYYPKLVIAAPVTPASGRRLLLTPDPPPGLTRRDIAQTLIAAVQELADALEVSGVHWLFTTAEEQDLLSEHGYLPRASFQFHWHNDGYANFDDFLGRLASRKRKQIRKERRRAQESIDSLEMIPGEAWTPDDLRKLDRFYRVTCYRHGGQDYLQPGFFVELQRRLPNRVRFARVRREGETIAGALYLQTEQALYGRYWGCSQDVDCLHFETAYYAGIEHCIEQGLPLFEAGAQGEHKLLRGFTPSPTYSAHWIRNPGLRDAIRRFLREERSALPAYMRELRKFLPYKNVVPAGDVAEDANRDADEASARPVASPEYDREPPPD